MFRDCVYTLSYWLFIDFFIFIAKSDALVFIISINWESIYGNKLPYITQKVVTMQYDFNNCEITNVIPNSFEECFNGKCKETMERDSGML